MATTNLNLPAISGSSQQGGFPATFNDAMGKIDMAYGDLSKKTAIPVTLANGSTGTITATRTGRVVSIRVGVTPGASGNSVNVGSFSSDHAPASSLYFICATGGVTAAEHNVMIGTVTAAGAINIYQIPSTLPYVRGEITYIV